MAGSSVVAWGLVVSRSRLDIRVLGLALVSDLGIVSIVVVGDVIDVLDSPVGEGYAVVALRAAAIALLVLRKVGARVVVVDGVVEGIRHGLLVILVLFRICGLLGLAVCRLLRCRCSRVRSRSHSHNSRQQEHLEIG